MELEKNIKEIESFLPQIDKENPKISKVSVGWHLEHALLIMSGSLKGLTLTEPKNYKPKFGLLKFVFLNFGFVPRGRIKAPKQYVPVEKTAKENVEKLINRAKERLDIVKNLPEKSFITHPFLGDLDKKSTLKFLSLHTKHHMKIVNDILKSS